MQAERVELDINGKTFFIESGVLAKQAAGSVVVGFEETTEIELLPLGVSPAVFLKGKPVLQIAKP